MAFRRARGELRRSETENGLIPALQDLLEVAVPDSVRADLLQGTVEVYSSPEGGARVQVQLPLRV